MEICIICKANICRSPMAEALLKKELYRAGIYDIIVSSAGIAADEGLSASEGAIEAMKKYEIDISWHKSMPFKLVNLSKGTILLPVTKRYKIHLMKMIEAVPIYTITEFVGLTGDINDPYGKSSGDYDSIAARLNEITKKIVLKLSNS